MVQRRRRGCAPRDMLPPSFCRTRFVVHPSSFVMHLPHPESRARLMIIDPANAAIRDKVRRPR